MVPSDGAAGLDHRFAHDVGLLFCWFPRSSVGTRGATLQRRVSGRWSGLERIPTLERGNEYGRNDGQGRAAKPGVGKRRNRYRNRYRDRAAWRWATGRSMPAISRSVI